METNSIDGLIDSFTVYLEINKNYATGTVESYSHTLVRLAKWFSETREINSINDITSNDLQLFLGTLRHSREKNHSKAGKVFEATTRARMISVIKQFFKWAVRQQYIQYDVSQYIENPKLPSRLPKSLTLQDAIKVEAQANLRKFKERDLLITILFLLLGIRVSELTAINLDHINFDEGTISIIGKGNKERRLALTPKILKHLDAYRGPRHDILKKRNLNEEQALFISVKRGQRLTRRAVEMIIEEISLSAGVKANTFKVSPHKLRHTCATVLYNNGDGADLLAIAELLGHSDPKTTTIYTKVSTEKLRQVISSNPLELS